MTEAGVRLSFSRASRLEGRHAFASVFAFKCSATGEFFQVYARPNSGPTARLGVTVNKRFVPLAVARNLCKRLARETFRLHRAQLDGVDFVVRARAEVPVAAARRARVEMLALMQRARQLCNSRDGTAQNR